MKRFPVLPTLVVGLAIAMMIGLGFWQLQRAQWKKDLLARYEANTRLPPVAFPAAPTRADERLFYRRSSAVCLPPVTWVTRAGRDRDGQPGWRHIALCGTGAEGPGIAVDLGWSRNDAAPAGYGGGPVAGVIGPDHDHILLLVADRAAAGLSPSAPPSLADVPNNHLAYAVQWFAFAAVALVIYVIAVRRRLR